MMSENNPRNIINRVNTDTASIDWELGCKIIAQRRGFIIGVTLLAFAGATLILINLPDTFRTHTTIFVERVNESPTRFQEVLLPMGESGGSYYETRVAMLKSRPILEKTIRDLDLVEHYRKTNKKVIDIQDATQVLRKRMSASVMGRTQIIKVSVKDLDPVMVARIANRVAENFVKESWKEKLFISDQLLKWFPKEGEAIQSGSAIHQLRKLGDENIITSLPSVMKDPVINAIKQDRLKLDAEIRQLSRRYTEEHPKMEELAGRLEYLDSELIHQTEKILRGLKASLAGDFGVNSIKVVEDAQVPKRAAGPKRLLLIIICTMVAFVLSSWIAIMLDYLNRDVKTEDDIRKLSIPFLGYLAVIPKLAKPIKKGKTRNIIKIINEHSKLLDEVVNIRTSVLFSMPADRSKFIMCTSTVPGEGKTTVSALLGASIAETGARVLVVDADMRHPSLHNAFGVQNGDEGLASCLAGLSKAEDVIMPVSGMTKLFLLPAGKSSPNPAVLIGSEAMQNLLLELGAKYDKIIFDVPPVLHISDGLILAESMNGIVLVFEAGKVHERIANQVLEKIDLARGFVVGAIINRVDYQKMDYRYYKHYYQYGKYHHKLSQAPETQHV